METTNITDGTNDIALVCDADTAVNDDQIFYSMDVLDALADEVDPGEIMEVHVYKQMPNRFLVKDNNGVVALCETREAAERIAETTLEPEEDEAEAGTKG